MPKCSTHIGPGPIVGSSSSRVTPVGPMSMVVIGPVGCGPHPTSDLSRAARTLLINPGRVGVFALVAVLCETARYAGFERSES
jgi:hypothetical protein